jgi:hypothetical protein
MNSDYDVFPKVLSLGTETTVSIRGPREEFCGRHEDKVFGQGESYGLKIFSKVDHSDEIDVDLKAVDHGVLKFKVRLNTRGQYSIHISKKGEEDKVLCEERVFAVEPEMMGLRPYKGDLHIHTNYSDGQESPVHVAIKARDLGMDFIAITDHDRYFPSIEAIDRAKGIGMDLLIFPGEEISVAEPSGSGAHIVSLCASEHVKGRFAPDRESVEEYEKEIEGIISNDLRSKELVEGLVREKYAHVFWAIKKTREFGGYVLLAHPYWEYPKDKYHLDRLVFEQLIADQLFDFVEISINTDLSAAKCYHEASRGKNIIPICTSDAHRFERRFGKYYTIVFAEKPDKEHIFKALFDSKCVAVGHHPGDYAGLFGSPGLVEYADFLMQEFFPVHDRICHLESELYMRILEGADGCQQVLDDLKKELGGLYEKYWAQDAHP